MTKDLNVMKPTVRVSLSPMLLSGVQKMIMKIIIIIIKYETNAGHEFISKCKLRVILVSKQHSWYLVRAGHCHRA